MWRGSGGLTALVLLAAAPAAGEASALEIVERSIRHHGGDLYRSTETRLSVCSKSGCFAVRAALDGGLYELEVSGRVRDGERRVIATNDSVRWWRDGEEMAVGERETALRDWVMARVYFCFLPFRLGDPGVHLAGGGLETWNGRPLHRIKVTFAPGSSTDAQDEYLYWFDPQSGRLEQFAYSYATGGGGLRFRRALNYRRVGGILFFDQENLGVEGAGLSVDEVDPAFVAERMRPVSTVELRDIEVR